MRIAGQWLRDVRFADDQSMMSGTEKGLQEKMNKVNDTAKSYDMRINVKKTKTMIISRDMIEIEEQEENLGLSK